MGHPSRKITHPTFFFLKGMVCNYQKKKTSPVNEETLRKALKEHVEDGKSIRAAAKDNDVPRETLRRWAKNPPSHFGSGSKTSVLTTEQQELIVDALEQCSKMGWPCGDDEVKQMVRSFLDSTGQETCFVNNTPGKDWKISFRRCWSERVSMRKTEILSKKRAENFNEETLNNFFEIYKTVLEDSGILEADDTTARIFNTDETGMGTNSNQRKLFFKKGAKNVYLQIPNEGKSMYTVLMCGSADGTSLGPLVVYKGKNIYNTWTENGPQNAFYSCTESGWMEHTVFEKWFTTVFIKHINENKACILNV